MSEPVGPNQFRCECCWGIFDKGKSDEEARAEAEANGFNVDECGLVCDDCFKEYFWNLRRAPDEEEDHRLDDPRYGQADGINRDNRGRR